MDNERLENARFRSFFYSFFDFEGSDWNRPDDRYEDITHAHCSRLGWSAVFSKFFPSLEAQERTASKQLQLWELGFRKGLVMSRELFHPTWNMTESSQASY